MWLSLALGGYSCLAVVAILDKYILSKEKVSPILFVFYSTVFLFPLLLVFPFLQHQPDARQWLVMAVAAAAFAVGLYTTYLAYLHSEISRSAPLIGGLIPLFILVLSSQLLGEVIVTHQLLGIFLLSFGTFIISFQKHHLPHSQMSGVFFAVISAFSYSLYHIASKFTYMNMGFSNGFIYIWGLIGVVGLLLLFSKSVRQHIFRNSSGKKIHNKLAESHARWEFFTVAADKTLSVVGVVLVQYAVSLGSVTKVNALSGVQFGLLIISVALLSHFLPEVFKERYTTGKFQQELFAVLVIGAGLAFLVR